MDVVGIDLVRRSRIRRQHLRVALPIDNRPQNPLTGHTHDVTDH